MRARRFGSIFVAVLALVWLNAYWCREVFLLDHFGQMQSIRGFWEGLARLGHFSLTPQWWPYSYNGMPFEYTYSPGVPASIATVSKLTGWSTGRAFGVVAGLVFCLGPVALFWMAWELTQRFWWSFIAALSYSLVSPSQLLVPDADFHWSHFYDSRRFTLIFAWDDVPHQLALTFVLLSAGFLVRGLRGRKYAFWMSVSVLACAMLCSPFGATVGALLFSLIWLSWDKGNSTWSLISIATCGLAAYLIVCPFNPPSLIRIIRENANLSPDYGWTRGSIWAILVVTVGTAILFRLARRWISWHTRLFLLLTYICFAMPFLQRWNLHFVPQPGRYKVELDIALALLCTFALALLIDRLPLAWRAILAIVLVVTAVWLIKSHRVYAKSLLRASDINNTIEYRVASWLGANAPGQRVMAHGSIGLWMNDFTAQQQFMGGSFTTMPTLTMQIATWGIPYLNPADRRRDMAQLWLQAYGVDKLVVAGPASPESWKGFLDSAQFEALFPLLWREQDTSIYSVPRTNRSLASIVPEKQIVRRKVESFSQLDEIQSYVAATQNPSAGADWQWLDNNTGVVRGNVPRGSIVSLHMTYHPGWKAFVNNSAVRIASDSLEQIVVWPGCTGPCEVRLVYDGGTEARFTRILSITTLLAAIGRAFMLRRRQY